MSERLRYLLFAFAFSMAVWAIVIAGGVRLVSSGGPGVDNGSVASTGQLK
jgi:hypothetical protein